MFITAQTERHSGRKLPGMRFIKLYLVGYVVLVIGIALALWQTGVLGRVSPIWIGIGVLVAIGVGIMLSVSSGKPAITQEVQR